MADITLTLRHMSDSDLDALDKALVRAAAAERSERVRANTLVSTGYGDRAGGTLGSEGDSAGHREALLQELRATLRMARNG